MNFKVCLNRKTLRDQLNNKVFFCFVFLNERQKELTVLSFYVDVLDVGVLFFRNFRDYKNYMIPFFIN